MLSLLLALAASRTGHRHHRDYEENADLITTTSSNICSGITSQKEKAKKIYRYVRDHVKWINYYNSKYTPEQTLRRGSGNCCDSAKLVVALARVQGLTVRFVNANCYFTYSKKWIGHVYPQFSFDGQWITADPSSRRNDFGVTNNWSNCKGASYYYGNLPF